jgi:acetyl esterase/lipase
MLLCFSWAIVCPYLVLKSHDVLCLSANIGLAPEAKYPRQLAQATAMLKHLIETLGKKPENIIIVGDSAGANLAIALLSHSSHPHPDQSVPRLTLSSDLCGLVVLAPWVSFNTTIDSFTRNKYKDYIALPGGHRWSAAFMGTPWPHSSNADPYNQAVMAPESWWEDVKVQEILVVAGDEEVLIDDIKVWANVLKRVLGKRVTTFYGQEGHDLPNLDIRLGAPEGDSAKTMKEWIASRL